MDSKQFQAESLTESTRGNAPGINKTEGLRREIVQYKKQSLAEQL